MRRILRENGLAIVLLVLFFFSVAGQSITGFHQYNQDQQEHQQRLVGFTEYLATGHFVEAIFENWESEFLQMGMYVLLTAYLFQKGSPESKKLDEKEEVDRDPEKTSKNGKAVPWPVRRGGLILKLYENSLCLALFLLFLLSLLIARRGGSEGIQSGSNRARRTGRLDDPVSWHLTLLVRVFPKLAKRVSFRRRADRLLHLPPPERLARIQAS